MKYFEIRISNFQLVIQVLPIFIDLNKEKALIVSNFSNQ